MRDDHMLDFERWSHVVILDYEKWSHVTFCKCKEKNSVSLVITYYKESRMDGHVFPSSTEE